MNLRLVAAVLAGVVAPALLVVAFAVFDYLTGPRVETETLRSAFGMGALTAALSLFYSVPVVTLYGLPVFLLLRRFRIANAATAVIAGVIPAIAGGAWLDGSPEQIALFSVVFGASAFSFWLFAKPTIEAQQGVPADGPRPAGSDRR